MAKQSPATKVTNWSPEDLMKCSDYVKGLVSDLEDGQFFGVSYDDEGEDRNEDVSSAIESARDVQKKVEGLHDYLSRLTFDEPFLVQMVFGVVTELELLKAMLRTELILVNLTQRIDTVHEAMRKGFESFRRPLLEFAAKCSTYARSSLRNLQLLNSARPNADHKQSDVPKRMKKATADAIARQLDKADPLFRQGDAETWATRIREHQNSITGQQWTCSQSTVAATGFWLEVMQGSGRSRKTRSVPTVAYSAKIAASVEGADGVLNELMAREEASAIDAVMQSGMTDDEKAAARAKIEEGVMSTTQALELAAMFPTREKPKAKSFSNSRESKTACFSINSATC